jgi:serine/threonine-protein kinase
VSILDAVARHLPPGYSIQGQLGTGATSWVYVARHERADAPPLAVKVMHPGFMKDADVVDRFAREMQILRTLDHPRIVPMLEPGEADGTLFFTMPYVDGETLRVVMQREGQLPLRTALSLARDIAEALGHAHGRGVVHRDIKPENVLVADGRAFLLDFGFANAPSLTTHHVTSEESRLTIGTPAYMSPEQVTGKRAEDWRCDFFSLACVLQEMLTGQPPFAADSSRATMQRRVSEEPDDVRRRRPDVPDDVLSIIRRNLAVSPNDRFATASFFRMALEGAIGRIDEADADQPAIRQAAAR